METKKHKRKKQYVKPAIRVVRMGIEHLLTGSGSMTGDDFKSVDKDFWGDGNGSKTRQSLPRYNVWEQ